MKISVVTVCLNCVNTITKTINSVLTQKNVDLEYIVIDGASDDGTRELIEQYQEHISTYISEPDNGIYDAMNKALKYVTGDIVEFLNGDDFFYDENVLYSVVGTMEADESIDVLVGKDFNGIASSIHYPDKYKNVYVDAIFPHQALFARKRVFEKIGNFDETYKICADRDWILRAWQQGYKFKLIDKVFVVNVPGGLSFGYDTPLEEYNIAVKYLNKTDQKENIPVAAERTFKIYGDWYVKRIFGTTGDIKDQKNIWEKIFDHRKNCILYGAGDFGTLFKESLTACGINVKGIIDQEIIRDMDEKIISCSLKEFIDQPVIISTSNYDKVIYDKLIEAGVEDELVIRYETIRKQTIHYLDESIHLSDYVMNKSQLNLRDYCERVN